jgi:hypothetical protein
MIFSKKKDARQYASKLAIEWLINNNHMPAAGGVSFKLQPMAKVPGAATSPSSLNNDSRKSSSQQVAELAVKLGIQPPSYVINPHEQFSTIYRGYAHFNGNARFDEKVGEFSNVYGKKQAKETCAGKVLSYLEGIAAQRAKTVENLRKERSAPLEGNEKGESVEEMEAEVKGIMHDLTFNWKS